MTDPLDVDICVIGAGAGGLSVAAGAAMMGARVALAEKGAMGGDCLNYGCVPSKALLAAGKAARAAAGNPALGVPGAPPTIDSPAVYGHVRGVIDAIAPLDSVERFEGLGVTVIQGAARFLGPDRVAVGDRTITARRFVVATGSSPFVPPIPGLDTVPYLTNETLFDRQALPGHLIILGGGPIGVEMAQAHRNLGCAVTVVEMFSILPKDDPELADVVRRRLVADGVTLREGLRVVRVAADGDGVALFAKGEGDEERLTGTHLLVAAGRAPNVAGLDLDAAGIDHSPRGIAVDAGLKTSNRKVYAIGDVAGGLQFTHVAGDQAGVVIRNALFRLPAKFKAQAVPWVTYTDPELAQVGLTDEQAILEHRGARVLRWPFAENDRAQAERRTDGLVKVVTTKRGRILGAGIVGPGAGELILPWVLALKQGLSIGAMAQVVAPYPTRGEAGKRAAGSFYAPKLFSDRTRKLVRFLSRFG